MSVPPTEELAPGVSRIRLGRVNAYLVVEDGRAVLLDSGLPTHAAGLLELLESRSLRLAALLLTHRHLDHAGAAAALARQSGARVIVHRADAAAVRGRERLSPLRDPLDRVLGPLVALLDRRVFGFRPCPSVEAVDSDWQGFGLRLLHLPGHTPGHSGYQHRASQVVFAGDAAIVRDGRPRPPSWLFTRDSVLARAAMLRLAALEAPLYCFGHGPPLPRGAAALRLLSARAAR